MCCSRVAGTSCALLWMVAGVFAQETSATEGSVTKPAKPEETNVAAPIDKRILGVLPNYRTADGTVPYQPLSARRKWYIGLKDSTDYPVFPLSASFAALYQLEDANPSYGQGLKGYAKRFGGAYADQAIGNIMAESLFPILLKEDPRYFRVGPGTKGRFGYAITRIFVTRTDSGGKRFNFSELLGNATTVAISNAYSPDSRTATDNVIKLGQQLATDAFSNILKEYWPDIKRKMFKKKYAAQPVAGAPGR